MGMTLEEALAAGGKPHGMTAEEAMAAGGRAHREPAKDPKTGLPLVSPRLAAESFKSADELGLSFGMADPNVPGDQQARLFDALSVAAPELSPVEKKLKDPYANDVEFIKEAAPFAVGGALGKGAGMLLGRVAAAPAGGTLSKAADVVSQGVENSFAHGGVPGIMVNLLRALAPTALPAASRAVGGGTRAGLAGAAGAAPGVAAMGANALVPEETPEQRAVRILLGQSPPFPQGE